MLVRSSYPILHPPVLSYPTHPALSYPILHPPVLSYPTSPCLILSYPTPPCFILSYSSCLILSYPTPPCFILSYIAMPNLILLHPSLREKLALLLVYLLFYFILFFRYKEDILGITLVVRHFSNPRKGTGFQPFNYGDEGHVDGLDCGSTFSCLPVQVFCLDP